MADIKTEQRCDDCGKTYEETEYAAWLREINHEKRLCTECWAKEKMRRY